MDNCKWCGCDTFFGGFHTSTSYPDDKRCKNVGLCNEYLIKKLQEENKKLKDKLFEEMEGADRNVLFLEKTVIPKLKQENKDKIIFLEEHYDEWKNHDAHKFLKRMNKEKNMGWSMLN